MMKPAHCAAIGVGVQHPSTKHRLVEPGVREAGDIGALRLRELREIDESLRLVDGDGELMVDAVLCYEPDRIARDVSPGSTPMK